MKELEKKYKIDEGVRLEQTINKEYKLIGKQRRIPGHRLFCFDPNEPFSPEGVKEVKIERKEVLNLSETKHSYTEPEFKKSATENRVKANPKLIYYQSLNHENAVKRAKKILGIK